MKKDYFCNLDYNRAKRRNSLLLSMLLIICTFGMISIFIALNDYTFIVIFAMLLIIPIIMIPSAFKTHPLTVDPIVSITDSEILVGKETFKIKDVIKVKCIIDLPYSKIDAENRKLLSEMKSVKPENIYFGTFDVVVKDEKGKTRIIYSHIDGVVDALETAIKMGLKHYSLIYAIKKTSVSSEYDFKGNIASEKEKAKQTNSKKSKTKQLI